METEPACALAVGSRFVLMTLAIVAIVFLGGLALNLTPCVLPMVPINLAIIGAGSDLTVRGHVTVDAASSEDVTSIAAGAGFGGTAAVTVNATVSVLTITTRAILGDGTALGNGVDSDHGLCDFRRHGQRNRKVEKVVLRAAGGCRELDARLPRGSRDPDARAAVGLFFNEAALAEGSLGRGLEERLLG